MGVEFSDFSPPFQAILQGWSLKTMSEPGGRENLTNIRLKNRSALNPTRMRHPLIHLLPTKASTRMIRSVQQVETSKAKFCAPPAFSR